MEEKKEILTPRVMELLDLLMKKNKEYEQLADEVFGSETEEYDIAILLAVALLHEIAETDRKIDDLLSLRCRVNG